jgi:quercetin dioxygenase-like cupin family protein
MSDADELDVERLAGPVPARFGKRTVELAPASVLAYDATSWRDAIVFVTAGEIELECSSGERRRFREGDILCLASLPVRLLRNVGEAPARLLAIWRLAAHRGTG